MLPDIKKMENMIKKIEFELDNTIMDIKGRKVLMELYRWLQDLRGDKITVPQKKKKVKK